MTGPPRAWQTQKCSFSRNDRSIARGRPWRASRREVFVRQLAHLGSQRSYGDRRRMRSGGGRAKKDPGSRYLTLRGYGIRAPGAVALGTMRPSYTETI
jgi:hypothetical protein